MDGLPSYDLELKAADERQRLHQSVAELRSCLNESLDLRKNAREHLGSICAATALVGLATGYVVAGIFVHE